MLCTLTRPLATLSHGERAGEALLNMLYSNLSLRFLCLFQVKSQLSVIS
ncbi:MAG: hypothetical protein HW419_1140 [Deltaproteobacteria bacterium]|nr:hypothetical protein [Deltaproteobacteria bacterium]